MDSKLDLLRRVPLFAGLLPLPCRWRIRFGAPIDLASEQGDGSADAANDEANTTVPSSRIAALLRAPRPIRPTGESKSISASAL